MLHRKIIRSLFKNSRNTVAIYLKEVGVFEIEDVCQDAELTIL